MNKKTTSLITLSAMTLSMSVTAGDSFTSSLLPPEVYPLSDQGGATSSIEGLLASLEKLAKSDADVIAISVALYEACAAYPDASPAFLASVVESRPSWSPTQMKTMVSAIVLAVPTLANSIAQLQASAELMKVSDSKKIDSVEVISQDAILEAIVEVLNNASSVSLISMNTALGLGTSPSLTSAGTGSAGGVVSDGSDGPMSGGDLPIVQPVNPDGDNGGAGQKPVLPPDPTTPLN